MRLVLVQAERDAETCVCVCVCMLIDGNFNLLQTREGNAMYSWREKRREQSKMTKIWTRTEQVSFLTGNLRLREVLRPGLRTCARVVDNWLP